MNINHIRSHILQLIENRDINRAKDYINDNISNLLLKISTLREAIVALQEKMENETNSDEILHLEYDLKDLKESLTNTNKNLEILNLLNNEIEMS